MNGPSCGQIVDEHHGSSAIAPEVPTKRGTLPIDSQIASILCEERSLAVPQPPDEGSARFLPKDVPVGQSPLAHRVFDEMGEPACYSAKKAAAGIDDLARRIIGVRLLRC